MRSILCLLVVGLFATTAAAQFSSKNGAALRNPPKAEDTAQKKTTNEKARAGKAGAADAADAESDVTDALLVAMDADRDGIVSKVEFNKAMAALRKVHKDKQGNMVVPDKAATDPNNAAVAGADAGLAQGPGGVGAPATADGRNNETMGRFMQMDANRDGVLSPNEVSPQTGAMLQGADTNRDGVINAAEMQAFSRRMGDRMRAFNAGVNPNGPGGAPGDGRRPKP
jgi:hypothetical protein